MTGRGIGYCAGYSVPGYMNPAYGYCRGHGRGFGRGWRRSYGRFVYPVPAVQPVPVPVSQPIPQAQSPEQEIAALENYQKRRLELKILKIFNNLQNYRKKGKKSR